MKKKLQQSEEQYLQSLKQENSLKQQLIEKNKEIQRLEIQTNNQFNTPLNYIKEKTNQNQGKDKSRKGSLLSQSQYKLKVIFKDNASNSNDSHFCKIVSQNRPSVLPKKKINETKFDKYIKYVDHTLTRNKQNTNHQPCRSISLKKERSSDEVLLLLKRNDKKTQRFNEATMKLLMNHEKKNTQNIKLVKTHTNKKLILPITLHQRTKSDILVLNSLEAHKDISYNVMKANLSHLPIKTISNRKRSYPNEIIVQAATQDYI